MYVPRTTEDIDMRDELKRHEVKSKADGGEVDIVVNSFEELADIVVQAKGLGL